MTSYKERPEKHLDKLVDWLNDLPLDDQKVLAKEAGTSIGHLRQIAYGKRGCNADIAVAVDRLSKGAVPMEYLHPQIDWRYVKTALIARTREERRLKQPGGYAEQQATGTVNAVPA